MLNFRFAGIDVFLALPGFLINTMLYREPEDTGRISLGSFYGHRARRLLLLLFLYCGGAFRFGESGIC